MSAEKKENATVTMLQKTDRFYEAPVVEAIAKDLIPQFHQHLQNVPILYFFDGGKMKEAATMSKRSDKEIFISGYKFILQVNKAVWSDLKDDQRIALVDHELQHAYVSPEGEISIVEHDIEEFTAIVKRRGIWNKRLGAFSLAVGEQLDAFKESAKTKAA